MSDPTVPPREGGDAPEVLAPAIGGFVVVVALSSLLDDSGLLEHPWWVSLAIAVVAAAVAMVVRTVAALVRTDRPRTEPAP